MKRIALAAIAAATFAAPLAISTPAAADDDRRGRYDRDDRRGDYRHDRYDRDYDNRDDRRDERRAYREGRRDGRHHAQRWDRARHNGYEYRGRWHYGPPPQTYYNDPYYRPGYHAWRRGDRLPSYYRDSYRRVDYRRHNLRAPPRGYHYVEDDRGELLLVGIATGVILGIIASN